MSLTRVGDSVLLQLKTAFFVWEPAWDSWRPITSFSWSGGHLVLDDRAYCADPLDPEYGYGSAAMREVCSRLTSTYSPKDVPSVPSTTLGPQEWFYDRFVSLTPCAPRDKASWKRFHKGRYRTPRTPPKTRLTKRRLR